MRVCRYTCTSSLWCSIFSQWLVATFILITNVYWISHGSVQYYPISSRISMDKHTQLDEISHSRPYIIMKQNAFQTHTMSKLLCQCLLCWMTIHYGILKCILFVCYVCDHVLFWSWFSCKFLYFPLLFSCALNSFVPVQNPELHR